MPVNPRVQAPAGLPDTCDACRARYRDTSFGLRFADFAADLTWRSRGPVLWRMRAAKLQLWSMHLEYCDGPFRDTT